MELIKLNSRFKKFGGDPIPNLIEYLSSLIEADPELNISIGCDSKQFRNKTMYANTVVLYKASSMGHILFYRESVPKILDTFTRLYTEAEYVHKLGTFLHDELSKKFGDRKDITEQDRKKYKYHLNQNKTEQLSFYEERNAINNQFLSETDLVQKFKFVDIHIDFNQYDGNGKNRSYVVYRSAVPWLRSEGFRVYGKSFSYASTSAADLLLK